MVFIKQMVAHLIRGVADDQMDLLKALGHAAQADGETVSGQDGEENNGFVATDLGLDILRDIVNRGVVAVGAGHDGLSYCDNILAVKRKALFLGGVDNTACNDADQIIALTDDGHTNTS